MVVQSPNPSEMSVNLNKKRKNDAGSGPGAGDLPVKKEKKELKSKNKNGPGAGAEAGKPAIKKERIATGYVIGEKPAFIKKSAHKRQREGKKKQLTTIVTEAKANYQLFSDKKLDKDEKALLVGSTYELVKESIPELARMKGMGKVIAALIDIKNKKQIKYILSLYETPEAKLLLMKGNGYKLAIKLIKTGGPVTVRLFAEACLTNSKGLRSLMATFQSARSLSAIYTNGNATIKTLLLRKLVVGNMPVLNEESPLGEVFASCKPDVIEGCKTFLQSILNEKSIRQEIVQDILTLCFQTQKLTEVDVESLVALSTENIMHLCQRSTKSALPLWVVWLSTAQSRKKIMKNLKGKVTTLLQTYNGRMFLIALIESTDDTKALDKFVLKELTDSLDDLVQQIEARKLLEYILVHRSTKFMHPSEIDALKQGDAVRTSKKSDEIRFEEIRTYMQEPVLEALLRNCDSWLQDNKTCLFLIAIIERYGDDFETKVLKQFATTLASPGFSDRVADKAVRMVLECLINADVARAEDNQEAALFINEFIPAMKSQATTFVEKCPKPVSMLLETATKLQQQLSFKLEKTWLCTAATKKAIAKWNKTQKSTADRK